MVDGGSLENCCAARHRGFESLFLRKAVAKKRNELARLRFFDAGLQSSAAGGEGCRRSRNPGGRGIVVMPFTRDVAEGEIPEEEGN